MNDTTKRKNIAAPVRDLFYIRQYTSDNIVPVYSMEQLQKLLVHNVGYIFQLYHKVG